MKLKKILKESNAPGFKNRKFGEPLPTLDSVMKEYQKKNTVTGKDPSHPSTLKEEYIEIMDGLTQGLSLIKDAWDDWKSGPMTERDDIKPAQKELMNYVNTWLKKNIK
tara:strand:+ start:660 stop:983 length:324 start_codon:yes stop_codon:yes gene_type:complete